MSPYLDHNATTPLRTEARERWLEVVNSLPGNPSSQHRSGRAARAVIDRAREQVARALGVLEDEILFTSGGTEANNLALRGGLVPGGRLVTSAVEHASVRETTRDLERRGHPVGWVGVDSQGGLDEAQLERELSRGCDLLSLQAGNNETGAVSNLAELGASLHGADGSPIFHTDAVQVLGRLPIDLEGWGADLASFSAHKVGGPPGVGVLWRRKGTRLGPILTGGSQESGLRAGTEDAAGIAAAAVAIELCVREQEEYSKRVGLLARTLLEQLRDASVEFRLLGPPLDTARLPNTLCLFFPGTDGKVLVTRLDLAGLSVSAGSACASGSVEPSHVLRAMGYDETIACAGIRLSLGASTSREDCDTAVHILKKTFAPSHAT